MTFKCYICGNTFLQKKNLQRHLDDFRCKSYLLKDLSQLNNLLSKCNCEYINTDRIDKNSINRLNIEAGDIKQLIILYDEYYECKKMDRLNILLSNYIKDVICNKENNVIKYIKKKPPTYSFYIQNENGSLIKEIKNLKDTCELLIDPIIQQLKIKLTNLKEDESFDYELYNDIIIIFIKKCLNTSNIKRALKTVLQKDILNNI